MNSKEIRAELIRDTEKIGVSSLPRILAAYEKERRKHKIDKAALYSKEYTVKTASKNNWMLLLHKKLNVEKYKDADDLMGCLYTYCYTETGLRIYKYSGIDTDIVEVYNGHFFKRYNERLQLNMNDTLSIAKFFFINNPQMEARIVGRQECLHTMGMCIDGIALGKCSEGARWRVYNTFVSKELVREDQEYLTWKMSVNLEIQKKYTIPPYAPNAIPLNTLLRQDLTSGYVK